MAAGYTLAVISDERQPLKVFTEEAYLDYSMYLILDRALPHIGEGLKPVQRRTVSDVLGKYHPHGDLACYKATA